MSIFLVAPVDLVALVDLVAPVDLLALVVLDFHYPLVVLEILIKLIKITNFYQ